MGGKGSGRYKKLLSVFIEEVQDELFELDDLMHIDKEEAHLRINRLIARLGYWRKKQKKVEEFKRRMMNRKRSVLCLETRHKAEKCFLL